jgi:DNA invertase Pin-like site-specific DNA recombinase
MDMNVCQPNTTNFNIQNISQIIIYIRVSTKQQSNDEKYGLLSQEQLCVEYVNRFYKGIKYTITTDIASSYNNVKALKNLDNLIDNLKNNTLIIVSEASRFGRNTIQSYQALEKVRNKNSYVISVIEQLCYGISRNYDTRFKERLLAAEESSTLLGERIKKSQLVIKQHGGHIGKAPFGYRKIKVSINDKLTIPKLEEDPLHQKIIRQITNLTNNNMSVSEIRDYLLTRNLLNKKWTNTIVKKIINKNGSKIKNDDVSITQSINKNMGNFKIK